MRKFFIVVTTLLLVSGGIYAGFIMNRSGSEGNNPKVVENQKQDLPKVDKQEKDEIEVKVSAVGDILIHQTQLDSQYDKVTKKYDFKNNFKYVKPYIKSADLAIANLETTLSKDEKSFKGYPVFISPGSIVDALIDTGFNLLTLSNNHIMDGGTKGFFSTQQIIKEKGIDYIGIRESVNKKSYIVKEIKGVKIGISNYTFETPRSNGFKTINSQRVDKSIENLIDSFNGTSLKNDLAKMEDRIKQMKAEGAEVIVFNMHWGEEYSRKPNNTQKEIAKKLSDMGVDIIFAGHPHVLQPIEFIKSQKDDRETLVVYSMGNFISNQRSEILKQPYGEDGIIVNITIKKNLKNNKITLGELSYVPTWVNRYENKENFVYEIVPLTDGLKNTLSYNLVSDEAKQRAKKSEQNTLEIIENSSSKLVIAPSIGS